MKSEMTTDTLGNKVWRNDAGEYHREDGPAIEFANGTKVWFVNGQRHREDGPAYESISGGKSWYFNGKLHRESRPAVECANGDKSWYINGKLHRESGPAYETAKGHKEWYINGKLHREDGPAVEYDDGSNAWYLDDEQLTEEEFGQWQADKDCTKGRAMVDTMEIQGCKHVVVHVGRYPGKVIAICGDADGDDLPESIANANRIAREWNKVVDMTD